MGILVALEVIKRLKARCVSPWTLSKEVGDEDQAGSRRREAGVRLREDRSEVLKLRSEKRHKPVAQQNGLVDNRR
jgi:hypothetical protein